MGKDRHGRAEGRKDLDLDRGVGHVVLAPDHVGHAGLGVVDHGRQGVEVAAVLADQHRVGQAVGLDVAGPAHEVVPGHGTGIEAEAPMRPASLGLEGGALLGAELEGGPVVDRRQAAAELARRRRSSFLGRLVGRVEPARGLQALWRRHRRSRGAPTGETFRRGRCRASQVLLDRRGEFGRRARRVGVVEAQPEPAAGPAGEQRVEQAGRALPICRKPVGEGAKRTTGAMAALVEHRRSGAQSGVSPRPPETGSGQPRCHASQDRRASQDVTPARRRATTP